MGMVWRVAVAPNAIGVGHMAVACMVVECMAAGDGHMAAGDGHMAADTAGTMAATMGTTMEVMGEEGAL